MTIARMARHILALGKWKDVISTGSAPAVPFLALARARGINCHFIESAARVRQPSLSAALLEHVPGLHCYSQYEWPERPAWEYQGSVFDAYRPVPVAGGEVRRVVVSLGANQYGFRRLAEALLRSLPPGADVLWQTGATDVTGLGIDAQPYLAEDELYRAMCSADLVVCHGGVGSALAALRAGHRPVLVPRLRAHGEHVDDHQVEIASELQRRGLGSAAVPEELSTVHLAEPTAGRVVLDRGAQPFFLNPRGRGRVSPDHDAGSGRDRHRRGAAVLAS